MLRLILKNVAPLVSQSARRQFLFEDEVDIQIVDLIYLTNQHRDSIVIQEDRQNKLRTYLITVM